MAYFFGLPLGIDISAYLHGLLPVACVPLCVRVLRLFNSKYCTVIVARINYLSIYLSVEHAKLKGLCRRMVYETSGVCAT